jgi:ribosomal-protein-alanine N-acetyltransferase
MSNIDLLFSNPPIFETERLILRRLELKDAEDYYLFASDPLITTHTKWSHHVEITETVQYLESVNEKINLRQSYHWAIVNKENKKVVGRVSLFKFDRSNDNCEIGFGIARDYWNKGIITEATNRILEYAFKELNLNRVDARCNEENFGSERVMQKIGMKYEGLIREQLKIRGEYKNQKLYSLIKGDLYELNPSL